MPVREALRTLESEGFVTTRRHAGACVAEPTEQEAADLLEIRMLLEPLGAARAAVAPHRGASQGAARSGAAGAGAGPAAATLRICAQLGGWFHETLAQAAGSPSLTALLTQLRHKIAWMYAVEPPARPGRVLGRTRRARWTRWRAGDAGRARSLMAAHTERALPAHRLRRPVAAGVREAKRPVNTARARH